MSKRVLVGLALVVGLMAPPASAGVIFFDDFEANPGGQNTVPAGWSVLPGSGTVEVLGPSFFGSLCAGSPSPGHCVDMDGSTNNAGTLYRDFLLAPGQYWVSFQMRGNARNTAFDSMLVDVAPLVGTFNIMLQGTDGWRPFSFLVTNPTLQTTRLSFAHAGGDNIGILIDDVQVAAVPEPGTLLLVGSGITALALRRRRKA